MLSTLTDCCDCGLNVVRVAATRNSMSRSLHRLVVATSLCPKLYMGMQWQNFGTADSNASKKYPYPTPRPVRFCQARFLSFRFPQERTLRSVSTFARHYTNRACACCCLGVCACNWRCRHKLHPPIGPFMQKCIEKYFTDKGEVCNVKYIDPSYMIRSVLLTALPPRAVFLSNRCTYCNLLIYSLSCLIYLPVFVSLLIRSIRLLSLFV